MRAERVGREGALALRWMVWGEWRQHPARVALAGLAIAVGVALGFAVHLVNGSANDSFSRAVRSVNGAADLQIRGASASGFDERLYGPAIFVEGVEDASPVVQLSAVGSGSARKGLTLLGTDILRAAHVTPSLLGRPPARAGVTPESVFDGDAIFLSRAAMTDLGAAEGRVVTILANGRAAAFRVAGGLPSVEEGRRIAVVDIAAAQWRFARLGVIDRIDLRLAEGASGAVVRERLAARLPASAVLSDAGDDERRTGSLSRAYRVNLDMLALVALLTGGFLVYSAQALSVTRRARAFALLRTLGLPRRGIVVQLIGEGLVLGAIGSALGLVIGWLLAVAALALLGGDLGGGYFGGAGASLSFRPEAAALFFVLGLGAALGGSLLPARAAARVPPAIALKDVGDVVDPRASPPWRIAASLIVVGALAALLPPIGGLPLFGYLAMALVLAGGVAAMPWLARALLGPASRAAIGSFPLELAVRHLRGAPGSAAIALCGIVASTALMIAMAVMVTSFRGAVDRWLGDVLAADLYLRVDGPEGSGGLDAATQGRLRAVPGVTDIAFTKTLPLRLAPDRPEVPLIVRPMGSPAAAFPLIGRSRAAPSGEIPVWLSEPASRLYRLDPGERIRLPIVGGRSFFVAGVWRDYARQHGAIIIAETDYIRLTGDRDRSEATVTLAPGASAKAAQAAMQQRLPPALAGQVSFAEPRTLRRFALSLFDRSFAITYALEAIAILVGLAGVAATMSAQTIARRREFGMLRHLGVLKRQITATLAWEGALLGLVGGIAGIALGLAMSQILIHVVNPQSFNWTMTTRLPLTLFAAVAAALVAAAAGTAVLAGRRALSADAVRAVREDW